MVVETITFQEYLQYHQVSGFQLQLNMIKTGVHSGFIKILLLRRHRVYINHHIIQDPFLIALLIQLVLIKFMLLNTQKLPM